MVALTQIRQRIDFHAIFPHFKVQMRAIGITGIADAGNGLPLADLLPGTYQYTAAMGVHRRVALSIFGVRTVVNHDIQPVPTAPTGRIGTHNSPGIGSNNGLAMRACPGDIQRFMPAPVAPVGRNLGHTRAGTVPEQPEGRC